MRPVDGREGDRKVYGAREQAERGREAPRDIIAAGRIENQPRHPCAEETAELMAQKHDAIEHREIADAEDAPDDAAGQRHGAEPEEANSGRERQSARMAEGQEEQ